MKDPMDARRAFDRTWQSIRSLPLAWSLTIGAGALALVATIGLSLVRDGLDPRTIAYGVPLVAASLVILGRWAGGSIDRLRVLAMTDPLTGMSNRRHFDLRLHEEVARRRRVGGSTCVVCLDVDHLKTINDGFGHVAGDRALLALCEIVRSSVRATDTVARLGGDEFALLLPDTKADRASAVSMRILRGVRGSDASTGSLAVSIGVAELGSGATVPSPKLLEAADAALYRAKASGGGAAALTRLCAATVPGSSARPEETTLFVEDLVERGATS